MAIDPQSLRKEPGGGSLHLVAERSNVTELGVVEKQFVNFLFLRVGAEWRKLDGETKQVFKSEFQQIFDEFRNDFLLFSYSLVGFDSKADMMFWRVGRSLDAVQDMTAKLYRTSLGSYLETVDNYLSVTKRMMFVDGPTDDRFHVPAGTAKYLFVYPFAKHNDWFEMSAEMRDAVIAENFMVGQKFPNIKIHLTHAFGFTDNEYLVSFETDEPHDFLALVEELRQTPASKVTLRGMSVYTCRQRTLMDCMDALG